MKRVSVILLLPLLLLLALAVRVFADEPLPVLPAPVTGGVLVQGPPVPSMPADSSVVVPEEAPKIEAPVAPPAQYRLQTEDTLKITVWGEQNLTGEHMIDPEGNINLSLVGQLHVAGLTVRELIDTLAKELDEYLVDPRIQVTITNFRKPKVHVLGEVNRPGVQEFKYGDRVMEAISLAGSFRDTAYLKGATLTRKGQTDSVPLDLHSLFFGGDMSKNLELQDGDAIYIPEDTTNKFYVLGEVVHPGQFKLKEDMTVMDAITTANGPTERGILKGTAVIRGGTDPSKPSERIELDLGKFISKADLTQNIKLLPGDVVYVPKTTKPDWSKISQVMSALFNSTYLFRTLGL